MMKGDEKSSPSLFGLRLFIGMSLPLVEEVGASRREMEIIMVENPRRALAF